MKKLRKLSLQQLDKVELGKRQEGLLLGAGRLGASGSRPHGCDSHLDADRLPSLLGGEPQGIGCCGAAVQHFGSCQHGFHAVLLVHVWIKVHFPS